MNHSQLKRKVIIDNLEVVFTTKIGERSLNKTTQQQERNASSLFVIDEYVC